MQLQQLSKQRLRMQSGGEGRLPMHTGVWLRQAVPLRRLRVLQPREVRERGLRSADLVRG